MDLRHSFRLLRLSAQSVLLASVVACSDSRPAPGPADGSADGRGPEGGTGGDARPPGDDGGNEGGLDGGGNEGGTTGLTAAGPSWVQPTSGAGFGTSKDGTYALQLTIGAPLPVGTGSSAKYRLRLGAPTR